MNLEQIIDELVYRKKKLDLDSPERQFIDRVLTGLCYSHEDAGGIRVGRYLFSSACDSRARPAASPAVP
jgi:hypothetical protein